VGKINGNKKYLFISIKPEFANKIVNKEKTIELRKTKPHVNAGDYVIIYASSPIKAVVGFGIIKRIIESTPKEMWEKYSDMTGIDKVRFDDYYVDKKKAIGIEIESIKSVVPIHLSQLRTVDANFHPPQIYRYVSNHEICKIINEFLTKI